MRRTFAIWLVAAAACHHPDELRWQRPIEIAHGGGTKGPWQQNNSQFDYVDDPSVALDAAGNAHVVWVDHRDKDVHFQIYSPSGTPVHPAVNVSRSPAIFSWLPRIVVDDSNTYVLWQEIVFSGGTHGGEIFFARSTDGGRTFSRPLNLSQSVAGDGKGRIDATTWHNGSLDLAASRDGSLYAAWTEYDGPLWLAESHDHGASFSPPELVTGTRDHPARAPSIATAPNGDVYLAWTRGEDRGADIEVARRTAGRFLPAIVASTTPTYSDAPKVAVDRDGVVHLAFTETAGGPFDRPSVHYARSHDRGASFERPRTLADDAAYPSLAVDNRDVFISWEHVTSTGPRGLRVTYSPDGGARFLKTRVVPHSVDALGGTNGSQQGKLMRKLAVDDHAIAIVNSSLADGRGSRVWMVTASR